MSKPTSIPGLRGIKSLGVLVTFYFDVIGAFKKIRFRYGDVVEFSLLGRKGYLVSDPECVREVLQADESRYAKREYDAFKMAFGNGLGIAKGKIWARQRKLLQPFFQKGSISQWHPIVIEETTCTLQAWSNYAETGEHFDVCISTASLLQRIMGRIMFGTSVPKPLADKLVQSISRVSEGLFSNFFRETFLKGSVSWITMPGLKKFDRAIEEYDKLIESILAMESSTRKDSLLTFFRHARYADTGETMSDEQIRDEVAIFFFAGQGTTADSLSWTLYYLAKHPEISDRIADEMERVSGGHPLTYEALGLLKFTKNVVNESLRLRPPVYAIERESMDSSNKFIGCPVKRGFMVTLSPSVTHCHPEYWDDPEQFNPDRFETDQKRFAFFPFGGGSRICIGKQLAMMEMITFVATAAYHYRFELAQTKPVKAGIGLTLHPRDGVFVKIKKREMKAKEDATESEHRIK